MRISIDVNQQAHKLDIDPETPLLWVLNEQLGLTGTKFSCGIGECGACTVLIDGQPVRSCTIPVQAVVGRKITTIEGFQGPLADLLRRAWLREDVAQCGYCQPGQLLSAAAMLLQTPAPTEQQVNTTMSQVLCRCGTYPAIGRAIKSAIKEYRRVLSTSHLESPTFPADQLPSRDRSGLDPWPQPLQCPKEQS